jgi:hypothetical protein
MRDSPQADALRDFLFVAPRRVEVTEYQAQELNLWYTRLRESLDLAAKVQAEIRTAENVIKQMIDVINGKEYGA